MTHTLTATGEAPGPDGNRARTILEATVFELRETQAVGRPYRYLEGRAVPYNVYADIGWFHEQHATGSFERSTKGGSGKSLPLLLFHNNATFPIGHAEAWQHLDDALVGVWRLNDRAEAQTAASMAEAGDLLGLSVGFQPIRSDWELVDDWQPELGKKDRVTRLESRLLEVSMTPTPAFADARVSEVREATTYTRAARSALLPVLAADTWRAQVEALRSGPSA